MGEEKNLQIRDHGSLNYRINTGHLQAGERKVVLPVRNRRGLKEYLSWDHGKERPD